MRTRTLCSLSLLSLSVLLSAAAIGCDSVADDLGPVELRPGGWGCSWCSLNTGNSPIINGASLPHWYLDRPFGSGNEVGPGLSIGKVPFRLDVDPQTDRFIGRALTGADAGGVILSGAQLVGAQFGVVVGDAANVTMTITDYDDTVASWSDAGAQITAYRASYRDAQQQPQPLCPAADANNQWFMLIAGERYDSGVNEVIGAPGSVTIACVGEAVAKMKLMDFHPNGNRQASAMERQATLRMITADYCGTGQSFTAAGTPVAWRDAAGQIEPAVSEVVLEAMWDEDGASCLNQPRYAALEDVYGACGEIPACSDDGSFAPGAVWRTMLPK